MRYYTLLLALFVALSGCSDVEPKPPNNPTETTPEGCRNDQRPICGCPGEEYLSDFCRNGEWVCPGPNGCPGPNIIEVDAGIEPDDAGTVPDDAGTEPDDGGTDVLCPTTSESTLPGVELSIEANECIFTLDEVAAGVEFPYSYTIDDGVTIDVGDGYACERGLPGLFPHVFEISGNGELYCLCDQGLCGADSQPIELVAGTYAGSIEWDGVNWTGPSDTGNPKGEPFPAGEYTLTIFSAGMSAGEPYRVEATFDIVLVE